MKNLTNPGKTPVDEDMIEIDIPDGGGGKYIYQHHVEPALSDDEKKVQARAWRDSELVQSDWIVMVTDHPQHNAYKTYRTKLRDWPSTSDFPDTKPELGS